jgi:hypothetical protein
LARNATPGIWLVFMMTGFMLGGALIRRLFFLSRATSVES